MKAEYKKLFSDKKFLGSAGLGVLMFLAAMVLSYFAGRYATESASSPVTDIILSNIPVFDLDGLFIYGPIILWAFTALIIIKQPKKIPFVLKSLALFVIIRSVFVTLTHIGPFPDQDLSAANIPKFMQNILTPGDLFFSGHTGAPFLMALIFYNNKRLFWFFSAAAVFFGIVVLMGHFHYSIDVLAAFFITYTIYHIASWMFKKDKELSESA